jgi:hypothetical protein
MKKHFKNIEIYKKHLISEHSKDEYDNLFPENLIDNNNI